MRKNVLVISTSLRNRSNSEALADAFIRGAQAAGNTVEKLTLKGKTLAFCKGCLACQSLGRCVIDDDANAIAAKMLRADVIVWATPIYYYEMAGQMKTLIDRCNSLYASDYAFRDVYLLSTAAEDAEGVDAGACKGLQGWIDCFEKARFAGKVFAGGVDEAGTIAGHPALAQAEALGRKV